MTLPLRPDLGELPTYVAGRTVAGAVKLASNEVPHPPLPGVLEAIAAAAAGGNRYPDIATTALRERLAGSLGVDPDQVVTGCGSVAVCQQLVQALCAPGDEVVFAWRSFEAYPIVTRIGHARAVTVPLDAAHRHDLDAMAAAVTDRTRFVLVCNPNNPTGTALRRRELEAFLARLPAHVVVVLDEAYREFVDDLGPGPDDVPDGRTLLDAHPNLVLLRTFSKAYRLAGLRVGHAVAPPELAAALRAVSVPFAVSAPAQAAATAALDESDTVLAGCAELARERTRVATALRGLGYPVPASQANFVWLPLGDRSAAFAEHALDGGVVVRAFAGEGVRVSTGTPEENDLFLAAAGSFAG